MLASKTVVLGVTGGIAAYKAADLASKLTQAGATVNVIMTEASMEFITPLTLRAITHRPVVTGVFELASEFSVEHVALAEAADIVVIVPATANTIARLAAGIADDMLTTTVLATGAPVVVAPAMNVNMWQNAVTQENVARLKERGFTFVGPGYGRLASGRMGMGRLVEVGEIIGTMQQVLGRKGDLAGKSVVVTAGGTREAIDPVRFIGNRSSGKMGYALAEAARDRGATVTLITAAASLQPPVGMEVVSVESVVEMKEAVATATKDADALIMAAAPADYVARDVAGQKIKKGATGLTVALVKAPDIISEVAGDFIKVGFSAETENVVENARGKLRSKGLHLMVANDVTAADSGFGTDTNKVTIIDTEGNAEDLPLMTKREVADKVLDRVVGLTEQPQIHRPSQMRPQSSFERHLTRKMIRDMCIPVHKEHQHLFPEFKSPLTLVADVKGIGNIETTAGLCSSGRYKALELRKGLRPWFRAHAELEEGDWVRVTVIERLKRYRLEILGKQEETSG